MKLKLGEITMMQQGLMVLVNQELPIKLSYKLSKILKKIDMEVQEIENTRVELVKKYGTSDEASGNIKVEEGENQEKFMSEYADLLNVETDINIDPISIDELPDSIKITPQQLAYIDKFILQE